MSGNDRRLDPLRETFETIFSAVCHGTTPKEWAAWLRLPLMLAAAAGNSDLVARLLAAGANLCPPRSNSSKERTPLHAAAEGGNVQVISLLMAKQGSHSGKDSRASDLQGRRTPLQQAIFRGNEGAARKLIDLNANVNVLDDNHNSALHYAIEGRFSRLAQHLLHRGAKPDVVGSQGRNAIHMAARYGLYQLVRILVRKGADPNCVDACGRRPLLVAVLLDDVPTLKALLTHGADPCSPFSADPFSADEQTLLHCAAMVNHASVIPPLVNAGVNKESLTAVKGHTPLFLAAYHGGCAVVLALLHLGAEVNKRSTNAGHTALHAACKMGKADAADILLRWGGDETVVDTAGNTASFYIPAVHQASEEDRPEIQRLSHLLTRAPQDRAWRRRGLLVMARSHQEQLRSGAERASDNTRSQTQNSRAKRCTRCGRPARGKAQVDRKDIQEGVIGCFDGVAAWLGVPTDEGGGRDFFRHIVAFL